MVMIADADAATSSTGQKNYEKKKPGQVYVPSKQQGRF